MLTRSPVTPKSFQQKGLLVAAYVLYLCLLALTITKHELWGDEIHSWNIAKGSGSYADLIANIRYEGHPPVWYSLMWMLSKLTHQLLYLQCLQFAIAAAAVWWLLFRSPLPQLIKVMVPFGYYLLFEYAALSRNYAVAMLFVFGLCTALTNVTKKRLPVYYGLLFLLSNTHLIGLLLACSIHLYFLLQQAERRHKTGNLIIHTGIGFLMLIPAVYFIMPPGDSEMNMQFWLSRWNTKQIADATAAPVKSLLPMPAWWEYHFWNTHFLIKSGSYAIKSLALIGTLATGLIALVIYLFRRHRKALCLIICNLLLTSAVAFVFPLTSARYVGFIYVSIIVGAWLMFATAEVALAERRLLIAFVLVQIPGGLFALTMDLQYPFSNAATVRQLAEEVPAGGHLVTDYWCLNNMAAFMDKPFYCLEVGQELRYILWDKKLAAAMDSREPYTAGTSRIMHDKRLGKFYLVSSNSPDELNRKDTAFANRYNVVLFDKREGAIERWSNVYLYEVGTKH